ncbi:DUF192 domain-containing protein [Luteimonas sp. e5]
MKVGAITAGDGGRVIVPTAWLADRWHSRMRGLLGRRPLHTEAREALWIHPCGSVHTFGMGYALDLVFLDRERRVCGWRERVRPGRFAACRKARHVIEFNAGALDRLQPGIGHPWHWQSRKEHFA